MRQIVLVLSVLFSSLTIFYACKGQVSPDKSKNLTETPSSINSKIKLDSRADPVYQDRKHNYWFLSREKGVYKFDGKDISLFTTSDGLGSYNILDVQEDSLGNIYFDTPEGVYKYDGINISILPIAIKEEVAILREFSSTDLWFRIGWDKKGPYCFDGEYLHFVEFPKNKKEDEFYDQYPGATINPYAIYSMYSDSKGNIWFGTSNLGIYLLDGTRFSWMYENHHLETNTGGNFGVRSIGEDKDGNYWICNPRYRYTLLDNEQETEDLKMINYQRQIGIAEVKDLDLYFYSMEVDRNGDLLMFAGDYGLWRNNGEELTQVFIRSGKQKISPKSMCKDREGLIWFGTEEHGIFSYDGNTFESLKID